MQRWILKALVQKTISLLPYGFRLNYFFQKYVSGKVRLSDDFFTTILSHFSEMREYLAKYDYHIRDKKLLELGTGWHPIMPMAAYLCGAEEVVSIDLNPHLRKKNFRDLLQKFLAYHEEGKLKAYLGVYSPERIQKLGEILEKLDKNPMAKHLQSLHIRQYIADAANFDGANNYFDICFSVNVLEHVDKRALTPISTNFYRMQKSGGYAYHAIGVYDHFVHFDQSISKFNYLRFSEKEWKLIDNNIQPQNRLRISWFRELFRAQGYAICDEIMQNREEDQLKMIDLHEDFKGVEDADIPYGTFILRKEF